MDLIEGLQYHAKKNHAVVGLGLDDSSSFSSKEIIKQSADNAKSLDYAEVVAYSSPSELVQALKNGDIQAAVRGNFGSKSVIKSIRKEFGISSIFRAAIMCLNEKDCFFLAPVGIDEGIFIEERLEFIKLIDPILQDLGVVPKIGIISGGRVSEDLGRSGVVDESLHAGEKLFSKAKDAGFDVKHYGVLIEEAYKESNVIIAPNGIVGNLLFRTLHLVGDCRSFGAPVLNLDKVFIDTSRSKNDYTDALMLASALADDDLIEY
jgi:putative methanogen marker protein 4